MFSSSNIRPISNSHQLMNHDGKIGAICSRFTILLLLVTGLCALCMGQNVGIGTQNPAARLHLNGHMKIDSAYSLEFGAGLGKKEPNAGKIGYEIFTPGGLDIVGAGLQQNDRKIIFWAEGGTLFKGDIITKILVVEAGAIFDGNSKMSDKATLFNSAGSSSINND